MKYLQPPLVAIFFMTYFYRARGGGATGSQPREVSPTLCECDITHWGATYIHKLSYVKHLAVAACISDLALGCYSGWKPESPMLWS